MHHISTFFYHLQSKALALGLEVPYFFCGLHHASNPAGHALSLDDSSRLNPWFSTEFRGISYSDYGSDLKDAKTYERHTWRIIAYGGNDYNYYRARGGTVFGYTNNNEVEQGKVTSIVISGDLAIRSNRCQDYTQLALLILK